MVDQEQKEKLSKQYTTAQQAIQPVHDSFDEKERLAFGKLSDNISASKAKSQVSEGGLGQILWERATRVTAQFPTGKMQSQSKKDAGKNYLADLTLRKYVIPNSNAQYDHLTKLQLVDYLSKVYGSQAVMYDYRVDDEYVGPDFYIIPMRNFLPQPGKFSLHDCQWVMVESSMSPEQLKKITKRKKTSWNKAAIKQVIEEAGDSPKSTNRADARKQGVMGAKRETYDYTDGDITVVTKYERGKKGKWITFCPEFDNLIIREQDNPHESGRIPVVMKNNFPLLDSIIGLGDIERGATLQKAIDSLINLYLDGVKYSIFPPLKVDTANVVASTIRYSPNAKWKMLNGRMDAVQAHQVSPQGTNTFVSTYQFLRGAVLNLNGTTDTSISSENTHSSQGKTPEALKQQAQREDTRDYWDRRQMEGFISELYEGMTNLLATKQEKPINFFVTGDDIRKIVDLGYDDVLELFDSAIKGVDADGAVILNDDGSARVTLKKSHIKSEYKYEIEAGTTMANDETEEAEQLQELLVMALKVGPQNLQQLMQQNGKDYDFGEHFKRCLIAKGIKDYEKIIPDLPDGAEAGGQLDPNGQPPQQPQQPQAPPFGSTPEDQQILAAAQQFMGQGVPQ